jgi:hypothetical protein
MQTTLSVRKPLAKVTRNDFVVFPIWEWVLDEETTDETFVRPTGHATIPSSSFAQFIVAAVAKLRDGTCLPACVEVTVRGNMRSFDPSSVFLLDRHLDFTGMETTRLLSRYTKEVNNYPTHWTLNVPFDGETKLSHGKVHRSLVLQLFTVWWRLKFVTPAK